MLRLLWQETWGRRGAIVGWGIGLGLWAVLSFVLYPSLAEQMASLQLPEFYKAIGDMSNIGSLEGFVDLEFFTWIPLVFGIYALIAGTGTLAGEEEAGTLELTMALPLPRWQLVLMKAAALGIAVFLMLLISFAGAMVGYQAVLDQVETAVTPGRLLAATLNGWPIVMVFAMLSLWLGAYLPHRRHAGALATLALIVTYFMNSLGNLINDLQPLQPWSPFYYFASFDTLMNGVDAGNTLTLLAAAGVLLLLAVISFQRRNVTVGAWPWERLRARAASGD